MSARVSPVCRCSNGHTFTASQRAPERCPVPRCDGTVYRAERKQRKATAWNLDHVSPLKETRP